MTRNQVRAIKQAYIALRQAGLHQEAIALHTNFPELCLTELD